MEAKQKKIDFFCMRNIFVIVLRRIKIFLGRTHLCLYPLPKLASETVSYSGWSEDPMKTLRSLHAGSELEKEG